MRDRIFYAICFGFLFGILLRSFVSVNFYFVLLLVFLGSISIFYFSLVKFKWGLVGAVFVLVFSLGIFRFHVADVPPPYVFEKDVGKKVTLSGMIVDEPTIKENNQHLVIKTEAEGEEVKVLLYAGLDTYYAYGDEVSFAGTLKKPENFITDTGKEFDYINYLRKDGILYVMSYPKVEIISNGNGNFIKSILFSVKEKFLEKINFVIPSPESLLLGGLILGEKAAFSEELRQSFVDTGTIHIVALSGYNVTIVAEWIMKLFSFLPLYSGIGVGIFAIILFILMTGMSSTAIRAGVMAVLALVARATGRDYDVARALILAGVFMVLFNPFVLVFDVSFQLSFIATVAVIFLAPKIEKYFMWVPERFALRDIVSVTTAAYIFVLPFILYKMGNLSLVALPANVLILPFIPLTMLLGFLTGFLGLIWYVLSVPMGYVAYAFLHYELGVIDFLSSLSFASMTFPDFPLILTVLIYAYFIYRLFGRSIYKFFIEPL